MGVEGFARSRACAVVKPAGLAAGFRPGRFIACELVSQCVRMCVCVWVYVSNVCARVWWESLVPGGKGVLRTAFRLCS